MIKQTHKINNLYKMVIPLEKMTSGNKIKKT